MKVKYLIQELLKYPDDLEVAITYKSKISLYNHSKQKIGQVYQVQTKKLDKIMNRDNNGYIEMINTNNFMTKK